MKPRAIRVVRRVLNAIYPLDENITLLQAVCLLTSAMLIGFAVAWITRPF